MSVAMSILDAVLAVVWVILHAGHEHATEPQGTDWPLVFSIVLGVGVIAVGAWVVYTQVLE